MKTCKKGVSNFALCYELTIYMNYFVTLKSPVERDCQKVRNVCKTREGCLLRFRCSKSFMKSVKKMLKTW